MFRPYLYIILFIFSNAHFAQVNPTDSIWKLEETVVTGYLTTQPLLETPTSVGILTTNQLRNQGGQTLLPALNSMPGVRMEERSPGSYRLSIRGSLLRSPWGVRNVKVYMMEFPLTDAGGNTYFNLLDPKTLKRIEVLKGPDGSLFGANSGGVVLIDPVGNKQDSLGIELGLSMGSYGMIHQNSSLQLKGKNSQFNLDQGFVSSRGYRENSALRRHYIQATEKWNYSHNKELTLFGFYANQHYETPGGLNEQQYNENPRQARQAAGPNPGAVEQQAGIYNKTLFGGIAHEMQISQNLRHVISVFGSITDFENPFITNFEERDERNFGGRTYLELKGRNTENFKWKWNLGLEWQQSHHEIVNYDNVGNATRGALQAADAFNTNNNFYFTSFTSNFFERLTAEAAISWNFYKYQFEDVFSGSSPSGESDFSPQWMPRLSLSYRISPGFAWRVSLSRGYSPPTTAEIRPSNMVVNVDLQAETGWNYETGLRFLGGNNRLQIDASIFNYKLKDAIVRRLDDGGAEYFTNAGGADQVGFESLISYWLLQPVRGRLVEGLRINNSYTHSQFTFRDFVQGDNNYSGNRLTGVPRNVLVTGITANFPHAISLSAQHNFTDRIPLNDSNSFFADSYHLLQAQLKWNTTVSKKYKLEIFGGVDNLLNEKYSLGNDINAFGNRFFNAAPPRNYYSGINLKL